MHCAGVSVHGKEEKWRRWGEPQGHGSHPDMLVKQLFSSWWEEWGPASSSMLLRAPLFPTRHRYTHIGKNVPTQWYSDTHLHYIYSHLVLPVRRWGPEFKRQAQESNSYAINLISYSVEAHFHLIQTTACIAKGNYISTASICPEVVDSQSKPPQVFCLSTLSVKSTERFLGSSMIYLSEIFIM